MAGFDISILSRLEVNTDTSASAINKTINSSQFQSNLNAVKVKLDVNTNDLSAFNSALDTLSGSNKLHDVKVGVTIDPTEAANAINEALKGIKLDKIKVDIDVDTDGHRLKDSTKSTPVSDTGRSTTLGIEREITKEKGKQGDETRRTNTEQENSNRTARETLSIADQIKAALNNAGEEVKALEKSYADTDAFVRDVVNSLKTQNETLDYATSEVTQLESGFKRVTIEAQRYNQELRRIQKHSIEATLDKSGTVRPERYSVRDETQSAAARSHREAEKLIRAEIKANKDLITSGSQVQSSLRRQNTNYQALLKSKQLDAKTTREAIALNQRAIKAAQAEAKAKQLQTRMLQNHSKMMQQNSRFINKSGMQTLLTQIQRVNTASSSALPQLRNMQQQMQGFGAQAAQATRSQMGLIENFNNAMIKFPIWMGASTLFFGAIRSAREFISTIIEIDGKLITLQKVMSDSANMDETFNDATRAAERFGQTLGGVLDAYAEFARQGYEGVDLSNFGDAALIASNVGEVSAQEASEFLTAATAQWQTASEDAMGQVDTWNNLSNNYATTLEKLGTGHAKAGATAKAMGMDFDETNAVIGALTAQTKQSGSEIGNFIKSAFPRMYAGAGRGVFEELGISLETANGETKNAITLLREAAHAMDGLSQADQADAIRGLGGVWHYQRMQVLLETLRDANGMYDQMLDMSRNSVGSAAEENAIYMESLEARINKAKVSIEEFSLALGGAFLESGILEFLTTFTSFLTNVTKAMEEQPAVAVLTFGTIVAQLLMLNKTIRTSVFGFGTLYKAIHRFGTNTAASSIPALGRALGDLNKNQVTLARSTALTSQSFRTNAQGAIIYRGSTADLAKTQTTLATTQRTLATTNLGVAAATRRTTASLQASTAASNMAAAAVRGLLGALRSIAIATGVGAVIAGITWALGELINKSADATNAINEFEQVQNVLKQSMESDPERVHELADSFRELEEAIQSGDYSTEQLEEHRQVTQEMAMLFPDLVAGTEEYGVALSNQQSVIASRIELIERQIEAERELSAIQAEAARVEAIETGRDAESDRDDLLKRIAEENARGERLVAGQIIDGSRFTGELTFLSEKLSTLKDINDLHEAEIALNEYADNLQANNPEQYKEMAADIDAARSYLSDLSMEFGQGNADILGGLNAVTEGYINRLTELTGETQGLGDATNNVFAGMATTMSSLNMSSEDLDDALNSVFRTLETDSGFADKMKTYEKSVDDFHNAATSDDKAAALTQMQEDYAVVIEAIRDMLISLEIPEEAQSSIIAGLESQMDSLTGLNDSYNTVVQDGIAFENMLTEHAESSEDAADGVDAMTDAITGLTDAFKELDGQIATIEKAKNELSELGAFEMDTLYELYELYPELLGQQLDQAEMTDFLRQKHNELNAQKMDNYLQELMGSEEVMKAIIADEDHKMHEVAKRYGIDLSNFDTVAQAKESVSALRNTKTVQQQNQIIEELGKRYGIDLSNFNDLASKKAAIEAELMQRLTEAWNSYIRQLQQSMPELSEFLKNYEGLEGLSRAELVVDAPAGIDIHEQHTRNLNGELNTYINQIGALGDALASVRPLTSDLMDLDFGASIDLQSGLGVDGLFAVGDASDIVNKSLGGLSDSGDVLGNSLGGAGDRARKALDNAGKGGKGASNALKGAADSAKKTAENAKEAKERFKDLNVEVETLTKTFQKQTFVLDQHEERLRKINLQIEKQNLQTERYATHSANYRRALAKENQLNREKLKAMEAQEKSLERQIKRGRINEYGMVSSDFNVRYNQFSTSQASSSGRGSGSVTTRNTGAVTPAKGSQTISPFAGWKVNFQYEPQGGGAYARQIGFNGGRHYGIDFGGKTGQAIRTPHGGTVVRAGWSPYGGGNQVEIYNKALDRTFTFMHMLGNLPVKTGQTVQAGQLVGRMGSTGQSTATHLHFQVNTGRGLNNARSVNPTKYLTSSSGGSFVGAVQQAATGSTATGSQLGKRISEDTANYLNAVEQARLDSVENAINKHNARENNKSTVQQARENLDNMVLDRLSLMGEIRETEFKIIESQIEHYDVEKNKLNSKISQLEYNADNAARLSGQTSDSAEWRKWMNRAQTEREKQLNFQNQQISYIEHILAADARKSKGNRMNEAYRFQLEERLRSAKEEAISLKQAIAEVSREILTSRVNQSLKEIDDALDAVDRKITLIQHRRHFIDPTYQKGADKYVQNLKEEVTQLNARQRVLNNAVSTLKILRSNLRQQPELYQQVNDKILESQEGLREIQRNIYDINKEIKTIRVDKAFERLDEQLEKSQKKFDETLHKRHFIDATYQKGADNHIKNLRAEIKLYEEREKFLQKSISTLKVLRKNMQDTPELHKRVNERIKETEANLKEIQRNVHDLNKDIQTMRVDKKFEQLNNELEKSQKQFEKLSHELHFINNELQSDLYFDKQADILEQMRAYRKTITNNIKELKKMEKEVKDFPELHKRVTDEIKNWEDQYKSASQEMHSLREEFASSFVDSIKEIYGIQRDEALKAIDKELEEYEKMINKKLKLIDKQADEDQYNEDIKDRQEQLQELRNEIAQRMGDDSLQNQRILKELQEELADAEKDYYKFIDDKERERRKEALQEELEDAREHADGQRENTNELYDDLLNDQRAFNKMQEEIMKGQIDNYKGLYQELTDFVSDSSKEIGRSISEGLIDGITTPYEALLKLTDLLKAIKDDGVPVPSSGLTPSTAALGQTITDLIRGVDNNFTLSNIGVSPSIPSMGGKSAISSTNNNDYNINSLINIENFRGTQKEIDPLLEQLIAEFRKLGMRV